jgi:hypothetical protein
MSESQRIVWLAGRDLERPCHACAFFLQPNPFFVPPEAFPRELQEQMAPPSLHNAPTITVHS